MKRMIIRWLMDQIFDILVQALARLAAKTSSGVDDQLIGLLEDNRADIIAQIKRDLS